MKSKHEQPHHIKGQAELRKHGIVKIIFSRCRFLALGVVYLTCAAAPEKQQRVTMPFVPGVLTTLDWLKDLGFDRVRLESCEPLSELAKSYGICETIHASGEQRTMLVMGERAQVSQKPQMGFEQPRPTIRLNFEKSSLEVEFVPIFPFLAPFDEIPETLTIVNSGQSLTCRSESSEVSRAVVSKKWILRGKKQDFPYEFNGDVLPVSALAGHEQVQCEVILFNGTLFRKVVAQAEVTSILRSAPTPNPSPQRDSSLEEAIVKEETQAAQSEIGAPALIFVPAGLSKAQAQLEAFLPPLATRVHWQCGTNSAQTSCKLEGSARSRTLTITAAGALPPNSIVNLEVTFVNNGENLSLRKIIPVVFDNSFIHLATQKPLLREQPAGTFRCEHPTSRRNAQDVLWFRNGILAPEWRGQGLARFHMPIEPQRVGCIWVGVENGFVVSGSAETEFMPQAPEVINMPEKMLVMEGHKTLFEFQVSRLLGHVKVNCHLQNGRNAALQLCKEVSDGSAQWQKFVFSDAANSLTESLSRSGKIVVEMTTANATFVREIPFTKVGVNRRPRIFGVVAYLGSHRDGHCLFLVQDPNRNHFTARVVWQDDPGRIQDFSTFLRNETTTLVAADHFFNDATLKPLNLFVGESIWGNISGRPSCEVVASNGVLFTSQGSRFKQSIQDARNEIHAQAKLAMPPLEHPDPETPATDWGFTSPKQNSGDNSILFTFRAGGKWEASVPASHLIGCTGHADICKNILFSGGRIRIFDTTRYAPGRAFLSFRKSSNNYLYAIVEIQNPAYSGSPTTLLQEEPCDTLVRKFVVGDFPNNLVLWMKDPENKYVPLASWATLTPQEKEKMRCGSGREKKSN